MQDHLTLQSCIWESFKGSKIRFFDYQRIFWVKTWKLELRKKEKANNANFYQQQVAPSNIKNYNDLSQICKIVAMSSQANITLTSIRTSLHEEKKLTPVRISKWSFLFLYASEL